MNKKTARRKRDLKTKLLAAVAMLLVSSLMMVTTTYAWFTLSTAPEVTGITTAVGANGNLEMALLPSDGDMETITSGETDSLKLPLERNITWGNLVDVSDNASYGMNNLVLYPARLNVENSTHIGAYPLATPVYGADGRVSSVTANTLKGNYDFAKGQFTEGGYGVRAVGTSSNITARELAHRNALRTAITNTSGANADASKTLNNNGAAIANIAIKHALDAAATFTENEIQPLKAIVGDLENIADRIELALKNYLIANSIAPSSAENTYVDIVNGVNDAANITAAEAVEGTIEPTEQAYADAKAKLVRLRTAIDTASGIESLTGDAITWTELSNPLSALVKTDSITVNGLTMNEIMADKNALVQQIIKDKFIAKLAATTDSGVLADIADLTGSYKASFGVVVSYGELQDVPVDADMNINTTVSPSHLAAVGGLMSQFQTAGSNGGTDKPISSFYGYIIDLAFRTNASGSWLQLQQEGIDRIYEEGSDNPATMGHGANMTFKTDSPTFGENGVKELMENIRIVFFNPKDADGDKIVAYAKLDSTKATSSAAGVTMPIVLTDAAGTVKTNDVSTDQDETIAIMQLTQNEAQALSVLVYLDGTSIQNADVAADAAQSMYGSMNLQFSSSADLQPMDYADLKAEGGNTSASISPLNNIVLPGNGFKAQAYTDGSKIGFTLTGPNGGTLSDVKVKFGEDATEYEATAGTMGSLNGYVVEIPDGVTVDSNTKITIIATETVATPNP